MPKVYRIENSKGEGPFHKDALAPSGFGMRRCPRDMPAGYTQPHDGHLTRSYGNCIYGFPTLAQLRKWFWKYQRDHLKPQGFRVGIYNVPDADDAYQRSHSQVTFIRKKATKVGELDLVTLQPI